MPVTRGDVQGILQDALKALFFESLHSLQQQNYERLVTVAPSGKGRDGEKYGWLSPTVGMRQFKDKRIPQGLVSHNYYIQNLKWENTLAVEREAVDSDQYGQVKIRINQLAWQAARFKDKLTFQTLANGFTGKGYDGKPFFSDSHKEGKSGPQSNIMTLPFSAANLATRYHDYGDIRR